MKLSRLATIACFLAVSAHAQNVTVINARDVVRSRPDGHLVSSSSGRLTRYSALDTLLQAVFTIENPHQLTSGGRFDYEMVITNTSKTSLVIPRNADWAGVDLRASGGKYLGATIGVSICPEKDECALDDYIVLYGWDDQPSSELILMPGDSVRILVSAELTTRMSINNHEISKAFLRGNFKLEREWLHSTPTPSQLDGYSTEGQMILSVAAKGQYPIDLGAIP